MGLKLKSGFLFDYDNLYGPGKVTETDVKEMADRLKKAHEAMKDGCHSRSLVEGWDARKGALL